MRPSEIKQLLTKHSLAARKALGQHFLIDDAIIGREVEEAEIKKNEIVLEIGPGLGVLTKELAARAKRVIAIERDKKLAAVLKAELEAVRIKNVEIFIGDALKIEWPRFDKLVANLPFQISSGVIERLGEYQKLAVVILQREFAERLIAEAGSEDYGRIAVLARYHFTPVLLQTIPPHAFWPQPEVSAALVKLYPKRVKPKVDDERLFFALVRGLFSHPNQNLAKAFVHARGELKISKENAQELAKRLPRPERRVYQLSLEELAELANLLAREIRSPRLPLS